MNAISFKATRRTRSVVAGRGRLVARGDAEGESSHKRKENEGTKSEKRKYKKRAKRRSIAFALSRCRVDVIIYDVVNSSDARARIARVRAY